MATTNTIRPQDLRIGNLVRLKGTKSTDYILTVDEIELDLVVAHRKGDGRSGYHYDHIEGIPVTDEVFKKLGFEEYEGVWWIKPHHSRDFCVGDFRDDPQHLHQLQNYIFVNYGEELDVTPLFKINTSK